MDQGPFFIGQSEVMIWSAARTGLSIIVMPTVTGVPAGFTLSTTAHLGTDDQP